MEDRCTHLITVSVQILISTLNWTVGKYLSFNARQIYSQIRTLGISVSATISFVLGTPRQTDRRPDGQTGKQTIHSFMVSLRKPSQMDELNIRF